MLCFCKRKKKQPKQSKLKERFKRLIRTLVSAASVISGDASGLRSEAHGASIFYG